VVEDGAFVNEVADDEQHLPPGHTVSRYSDLGDVEKMIVELAKESAKKAYCPYSNFPVGAAVWAENAKGEKAAFWGANRETKAFNGSCAERSAIDDAVKNGYTKILLCAVYCDKNPGGSPCPRCRQDLREHGIDATVLNIFNEHDIVVKFTVRQLFHNVMLDDLVHAAAGCCCWKGED
jgi:cytidine deaminase